MKTLHSISKGMAQKSNCTFQNLSSGTLHVMTEGQDHFETDSGALIHLSKGGRCIVFEGRRRRSFDPFEIFLLENQIWMSTRASIAAPILVKCASAPLASEVFTKLTTRPKVFFRAIWLGLKGCQQSERTAIYRWFLSILGVGLGAVGFLMTTHLYLTLETRAFAPRLSPPLAQTLALKSRLYLFGLQAQKLAKRDDGTDLLNAPPFKEPEQASMSSPSQLSASSPLPFKKKHAHVSKTSDAPVQGSSGAEDLDRFLPDD